MLQWRLLEVVRQLSGCLLGRCTTQRRTARGPRLATLVAHLFVPDNLDHLRRQARFLAHGLPSSRVYPLAHLRIAVQNFQPATLRHPNLYVSAIDRAVPYAGALDATADAGVFRLLVNIFHRLERL